MQKYILITVLVLATVIGLAFKQVGNEPVVEKPQQVATENTEPLWSDSKLLGVVSPVPGAEVQSPLLVKGVSTVSEEVIHIRLKDANNAVVVEKVVSELADSDSGKTFGELLVYETVATDTGTLEVYSTTATDATEKNLVAIPVQLIK